MEEDQRQQIEEFIFEFLNKQGSVEKAEVIRKQFRSGYCWHFANMLKDVFHRGELLWTAPLGHIVWFDPISNRYYDIEGEYEPEKHDVFYMIPVSYLGFGIRFFMHIPNDGHREVTYNRKDLVDIVKKYCDTNNILYNEKIEQYFIEGD